MTSLNYIPITFFFFIILILVVVKTSYCNDNNNNEQFTECSRLYSCGNIQDVRYPFWGDGRPKSCGLQGFELKCINNIYPIINIASLEFRVLNINQSTKTMTIARMDFWTDICPEEFVNTTLSYPLFDYTFTNTNLTIFYNCSLNSSVSVGNKYFTCSVDGAESVAFYGNDSSVEGFETCKTSVRVPILGTALEELNGNISNGGVANIKLLEALKQGFDVVFNNMYSLVCSTCEDSGGICGSSSSSVFMCLCGEQSHSLSCPISTSSGNGLNLGVKLGIGFGAAGFTFAIMFVGFFIYQRRNRKKYVAPSSYVSRNISSDYSSMSDLEKMGSYFGVHIFTYEELEEATNNFDSSKELGDGGFGTVYYGKLRDGRVVAVKRLYESNYKRVEQFMNEVEILTRLRHKNLVLLYGCTSRHSRELLLVYEYISNGTVADHLHGERAKPRSLPWPIRLKIAIETASALAYLHASDIIHRDVKTNNILLDDHFCVKVADFGLSRLFPTDVTHISTAPQGTPGYVDPDYHQCYQLTDKSDVYSFGVVLIELISSKPAVDITRHRHEINLSNMAINKIQNRELHELVDPSIGFESDCTIKMMVTAVAALAFQCLQSEKDMRPTMEEVFESLKDILQYNEKPAEEVDIPADDVVKLKSVQPQLPLSPDSVTANWVISSSSTTNGSG